MFIKAGTSYRSAPFETVSATTPPGAIESPADGSVESTRPCAISSSKRSSVTVVSNPRATSVALACSRGAPTTEGNFTDAPGPARTHQPVTLRTRAKPAAIQRLRLTLLLTFLRALT